MSVFILYQNDPCIEDYSDIIKKPFPKSSIITTNSIPTLPRTMPLLTDKWLILVYLGRNYQKQIEASMLFVESSVIVFICKFGVNEICNAVFTLYPDYTFYDRSIVSPENLQKYVQHRLSVSPNVAKKIVERSGKYESSVVKNVEMLRILPPNELTNKMVDLYIPERNMASFNYVYQFLVLGVGNYSRVVKLVRQYQYSIETIVKFLVKRLNSEIEIFEMIMDAKLTGVNYLQVASELKEPIYKIENSLLLFNKVTLEHLVVIRSLLSKMTKYDPIEFLFTLKGVVYGKQPD